MRLGTALFLLLVLMLATGAKANIQPREPSPIHWRLVAETAIDGKVLIRKPINRQRYTKAGQCARDGSLMGGPPTATNPRVSYSIACLPYRDEDSDTVTP